jgi:hypothetical protein
VTISFSRLALPHAVIELLVFLLLISINQPVVLQDGDFLVRESQGSPGQYVLTGMQGGLKKHLLLVDPEGVVSILTPSFMNYTKLIHHVEVVCFCPHL